MLESDRTVEIPLWPDTHEFIQKRMKVLKTLPKIKSQQKPTTETRQVKSFATTKSKKCLVCGNEHPLYQCSEFIAMTVADRYKKVKEHKLCFNCLGFHSLNDCKSKSTCKTCSKKHNSLLHRDTSAVNVQSSNNDNPGTSSFINPNAEEFEPGQAFCSAASVSQHQTLLSTASILIRDDLGLWHKARALLDSGSDSNFITKSSAQALNIMQENVNIQANGLGSKSMMINKKLSATFSSRIKSKTFNAEFLITPKITGTIPSTRIDKNRLRIPSKFQLADPAFDIPGRIDVLIGNALFWDLIHGERIKLDSGTTLIESELGWIVAGAPAITSNVISTVHCNANTINDLQFCEQLFERTHQRNQEGRFIVKIPFKENLNQLTSNNGQAYHQFLALEKRLQRNEHLKSEYIKFMDEYEQLGHMQEVKPATLNDKVRFYFPHHAVEKPDSTTTKVRVVFNGSAKTPSGLSLNDVQCVGPKIQSDGISLALKFRSHAVVVTADIAKMYRMIEVIPEQRNYQSIFWRKSQDQPIKTYELKTITYGTACASFQSTRCLKQLAIESKEIFPKASHEIATGFYVDDLITGASSSEKATKLFNEIDNIIKGGAMNLRKVHSNHRPNLVESAVDSRDFFSQISHRLEPSVKFLSTQFEN